MDTIKVDISKMLNNLEFIAGQELAAFVASSPADVARDLLSVQPVDPKIMVDLLEAFTPKGDV